MWAKGMKSRSQRNICLVTKGESVVPKKVPKLTLLEREGYEIVDYLGEGAFATVKLAQSKKHGCRVAIKTIDKLKATKDVVDKFLPREVKIMKELNHPNIIKILEAFETKTKVHIVMEYAAQGDLLQQLNFFDAPPDEEYAKMLFFQLVKAMAYCHSKNIAHRDLKPENLLLDSEGHLKVTDFGFASDQAIADRTLNTFCGSQDYAAPELLRRFKYNGQVSDIWAMGVTLYVMLNKKPPFTKNEIQRLDFRAKVKFVQKVSKDCKNICRKMLIDDVMKRATMAEVLECAWLKKVPKKNPDIARFSSSNIQANKPANTESTQKGQLILKCASEYSAEDMSRERRSSTLVSDVVNAAKEPRAHEEFTQERKRQILMKAQEPNPIDDLVHYKHMKYTKYQVDEEKALEVLKESRAAYAAHVAAEESKEQRRKSTQHNQVKTLKSKYGNVLAPPS